MAFKSFKEISARLRFDPECEITVDNCESVVDEYQFPIDEAEVLCQARQLDKPKRCNEGHRHGWLGRRKDNGREALIGIDCGNKYFRGNANFLADTNRIKADTRIDAFINQLKVSCGRPDLRGKFDRHG